MRTIEEDDITSDRFEDDPVDHNDNRRRRPRPRPRVVEEEKVDVDVDVMEEEGLSAPSSSTGNNNNSNRKKKKKKKKRETNGGEEDPAAVNNNDPKLRQDKVLRTIFWTRVVSFLLLLATTAFLCFRMYQFMMDYEQEQFQDDFDEISQRFLTDFEACIEQRLAVVTDFAMDISATTSTTTTTTTNNTSGYDGWPYVTVPNFAKRAQSTAKLADLLSLAVHPFVYASNTTQWHEFFARNHEQWVQEGLHLLTGDSNWNVSHLHIPQEIWKVGTSGEVEVEEATSSGGPLFVPQWQSYPAIEVQYANYNLYSSPVFAQMVDAVIATRAPVFANSYNLTTTPQGGNSVMDGIVLAYNLNSKYGKYENDPIVSVLFPIFEHNNNNNNQQQQWQQDETVVGVLLARVYWRTCLPTQKNDGLVAVIASSDGGVCQEEFSYTVGSEKATYLGDGDLHDTPKYDDHSLTTNQPIGGLVEGGGCPYDVTIYASSEFQEHYQSILPLYFAFALGVMFLITSILHFIMSCCVERRRVHLIEKANKSAAVVRNLFPKEVRQQVYNEALRDKSMDGSSKRDGANGGDGPGPGNAIANLYPECTICFGDIAGFTKWSSSRSPIQVFELLEAIYGSFDKIAKRLHVFKIETIGDCYVCATGLPKKQSSHAVIMARFASEALEALQDLIAIDLRDRLGDDTAGLAMRFGMHSGPVTAGVLRGDKSRFQIFGDTVNTAARMESNGTRGRIQVSESTATLLTNAGKEKWLTAREDLVAAKGKGMMQCYWVDIGLKSKARKTTTTTTRPAESGGVPDSSESSFTHGGDEIGYSSTSNTSVVGFGNSHTSVTIAGNSSNTSIVGFGTSNTSVAAANNINSSTTSIPQQERVIDSTITPPNVMEEF